MPGDDIARPAAGAGSDPPTPAEANLIGRLLMALLQGMPFLFGIGFIAPLTAQLLIRELPEAAHAQWPVLVGLVVGGSWGAVANLRGRWI
jgi:hypothetical protein